MPGPRLLAALCGLLLCASGLFAGPGDFGDSIECLNGGTRLSGQDELPFYCLCPKALWGPFAMRLRKIRFQNPCHNDVHLHHSGLVNAWTAGNYDRNPWIQVKLLRKMHVTGMVTQGTSHAGRAEYMKMFKVAYSLDRKKFKFIQEDRNSGDKVFMGNVDNSSLKDNMFDFPQEVQYVRLVPVSCHWGCTLCFELLGCELNAGCDETPGHEGQIHH